MKQGDKIEIILKDARLIGYFQYKERGTTWISMDYSGMFSYGVHSPDIKKIVEL